MRVAFASAIVAAALVAGPSQAQDNVPAPQTPPASVSAMIGCRAMTDSAARLACYDRAVGDLQTAVAQREVVIFSAADVQKTRRSLFGFALPKLPFFGDSDDTPEAKELNTKIVSARSLGYGKWRIQVEGGALWETTESSQEIPSPGHAIRIRRGALGSYMMNIAGAKGVRARRLS